MCALALATLLAGGCVFTRPFLTSTTDETGRAGTVEFDVGDLDAAERMAAEFCGGRYRRTDVGTFLPLERRGLRFAQNRITMSFACIESGDAGVTH
jgi:hypothetical protein